MFFVPGWASKNGGLSLTSLTIYVLISVAVTLVMTWVYNRTQGSLLMAMLVHTSVHVAQEAITLFFPALATTTIYLMIGFSLVAFVVVVVTRSRLGYRPREEASIP